MSANSKIEWTDATWNPLHAKRLFTGKVGWHCEKISPACDHCYAASMNKRCSAPAHRQDHEDDRRNQLRVLEEERRRVMTPTKQVDLDALDNIACRLDGLECETDADVVTSAIATLRAENERLTKQLTDFQERAAEKGKYIVACNDKIERLTRERDEWQKRYTLKDNQLSECYRLFAAIEKERDRV